VTTALEGGWDLRDADGPYHAARRRLREAIPPEAKARLVVNYVVVWGEPYAEILSYAGDNDVDLICMGAQGADFRTWSLFGSNVDRVLRQAPCPAYVARPLKPAVPFA
jgi:nucleotide-binding universal stress UspA family protein